MLTYTFQFMPTREGNALADLSACDGWSSRQNCRSYQLGGINGEPRLCYPTIIESALHTKIAQYQIYTKYKLINPVLQDLVQNLSPFVVNVIALSA